MVRGELLMDDWLADRQATLEWYMDRYGFTPRLTCDSCSIRSSCDVAYDLYNTDGDCLMDK